MSVSSELSKAVTAEIRANFADVVEPIRSFGEFPRKLRDGSIDKLICDVFHAGYEESPLETRGAGAGGADAGEIAHIVAVEVGLRKRLEIQSQTERWDPDEADALTDTVEAIALHFVELRLPEMDEAIWQELIIRTNPDPFYANQLQTFLGSFQLVYQVNR